MSLQDVVVIWLDGTFVGDNYRSMKDDFNQKLGSTTSSSSSDEIDCLICKETKEDLVINGAPVITVSRSDEAMQQIETHSEAKIFFISSGSLGKDMVPTIVRQYPLIHSFYIFCFDMATHGNWALDYTNCLKIFDHPIDLLVRLMRDISTYFIEQGKLYLKFNDPNNALKYFKYAWNLETRANQKDKVPPNTKSKEKPTVQPDCRTRLNLLEGENGLIRQAEKALGK
ncbi:unnamed protein product [Rotaria sordida]|uniref:Uncharacterized protein n=1 Tax=Rotaria sordida TaxID=392033 RepID=A0A813WG79_9BILA|nr:unnamed protein product [Rotaria sordida]CAF3482801.1 unnamed protein product [Rotaria sordida]